MTDILITITQALQLVALVPTIFVIVFLMSMSRWDGSNLIPILYFFALGCQFLIPLLPVLINDLSIWVMGGFWLGASTISAFSFLLIIQFLCGKRPPLIYWSVLAIPLIGGSPFLYASLQSTEVCLDKYCIITDNLRTLYDVASSCLIFLLLIIYIARGNGQIAADDIDRKHKYWLIISLVMLNLAMIAIQLLNLNENLTDARALLISTVIRIGFIYLVLTSIFRLFYDIFEVRMKDDFDKKQDTRNPEQDQKFVQQLKDLFEYQHIYREMGLSRTSVSQQLGMSEQQLSRIINSYFKKNFNELANHYRVEEAKNRLRNEPDTQVTVIAYEVGFNSIASFNRVFKDITGSSPTSYRTLSA